MNKYIKVAIGIVIVLLMIPPLVILKARVSKSSFVKIHIIHDMDNQEKYKSQMVNPMFADTRAMRPQVEGTVFRTQRANDDAFSFGKIDEETFVSDFPIKITKEIVKKGRIKYDVYCSNCHGFSGYGDGMIAKRAEQLDEGTWVPPTSLHTETVRDRPVGHIFNTITNGIRTMQPYADQLLPEDRWAVVAYIKALQKSQNATLDDVPSDKRDLLKEQEK